MDILEYHQRTRHEPGAFAAGPETIDWDNQPDPFRRYDGAELISLLLSAGQPGSNESCASTLSASWADLWQSEWPAAETGINRDSIALLLELSLALSAWKQYGTAKWSLRVNPSSGNLHPTECYLLVANIDGLSNGLYHYRADLHALELRCVFHQWDDPRPQLLMGFSSVFWREAWKYGERAYRYCCLDVGHALAAVSYSAALVFGHDNDGQNSSRVRSVSMTDRSLEKLLGLDRQQDFGAAEAEHPDCLLALTEYADVELFLNLLDLHPDSETACLTHTWYGQANVLDPKHFYQWPVVEEAAKASAVTPVSRPVTKTDITTVWPQPVPATGDLADELASRVIRHRRSAQGFNPEVGMSQRDFFAALDHCLPRPEYQPWNSLPQTRGIHLFLFVHKVEGLPAGLYALLRSPDDMDEIRVSTREQFLWQAVAEAPEHLPLYMLIKAGTRRTAAGLSCQQAIAGDSAFSLAMVADMSAVSEHPEQYRYLHWQAGAIGQVLYLEAEAAGLRGTGIGCFFDDRVHDLLGVTGSDWKVVYHFTVGEPIVDQRITTLRAYT